MKKQRILSSVINNISFDQRVEKLSQTFLKKGYDVKIIGSNLNGNPTLNTVYSTERLSIYFKKGPLLYSEFQWKLFWKLLKEAQPNDILWANDLDTLLPNYLVSKIKKLPLVFDSHELFSELPSVKGRNSQKIWRWMEKNLSKKVDKTITVSDSIADWWNEAYEIDRPLVIKNLPIKKAFAANGFGDESPKYVLYQGAINPSRGLIPLVQSTEFWPENLQLKIAGDGPFLQELKKEISLLKDPSKVELLGMLPPDELLDITKHASIGASLEENGGLSYSFALPNKLFDYIQAKIPIVATYLPEIKQVVESQKVGEIIPSHAPKDIADTIALILANGKEYYAEALENASNILIWENQEEQLYDLLDSLTDGR